MDEKGIKNLDSWRALRRKCESPIEETMLAAFCATEQPIIPVAGPYSWDEIESVGKEFPTPPLTMLWSQEKILRFRVDFLIARYNPLTGAFRRLVVECDGHQYHGSIRQQKIDSLRDRKLRPHVGGIVHLGGAEIARSSLAIAWDILWLLEADDEPQRPSRMARQAA